LALGAVSAGAPSMTVGTDGMPFVSYYDSSQAALKVAHCSNELCFPFWRRR